MPVLDRGGDNHYPLALYTYEKAEVQFQHMRARPFDDEGKRLELARHLNEIGGVGIPEGRIRGRPSVPLAALRDEGTLRRFLMVFDRYVREVEAASPTPS